jgi:hypothetical protein
MAVGDRLAFYLCNVTFTPSGGSETIVGVSSINLDENIAMVDVTTTEDDGYANQIAALSTIAGSISQFKKEGQDLSVKARQKGLLKWYDLKSNVSAGNHSLNVQIGTITRGQATVQGAIPCTINFVGQGKWANGSWGA